MKILNTMCAKTLDVRLAYLLACLFYVSRSLNCLRHNFHDVTYKVNQWEKHNLFIYSCWYTERTYISHVRDWSQAEFLVTTLKVWKQTLNSDLTTWTMIWAIVLIFELKMRSLSTLFRFSVKFYIWNTRQSWEKFLSFKLKKILLKSTALNK